MGYLALAGVLLFIGLCHGQQLHETEDDWEFDADYARDLSAKRK